MKKKDAYTTNIEILLALTGNKPISKESLHNYVGMGALPEILDRHSKQFGEEVNQMENLIRILAEQNRENPDTVWNNTKRGTLTAYYTPENIINAIYEGLHSTGRTFEKVLEPAAGAGAFLKYFPEDLKGKDFSITAIEKDFVSSKVLEGIYKDDKEVKVIHDGFENHEEGEYDLVVSNIPFGDVPINDLSWRGKKGVHREAQRKIHNYFFLKGQEKLKDDGILAFVTSMGVMDSKKNIEIREELVKKADFIGAVRLNENTFKDAGTKVSTDIIFLRKNENKEQLTPLDKEFIEGSEVTLKDKKGKEIEKTINSFFVNNPEAVLGEYELGGAYRGDSLSVKGEMYESDENGVATVVRNAIEKQLGSVANLDLERAADYAEEMTERISREKGIDPVWVKEENGDLRYSEEAQEIFNQHYDNYPGENVEVAKEDILRERVEKAFSKPSTIREGVANLLGDGFEIYLNTLVTDADLLHIIDEDDKTKALSVSEILGFDSEKDFFVQRVVGRPTFAPDYCDKVMGYKDGAVYTREDKIELPTAYESRNTADADIVKLLGGEKRTFRDTVALLIKNGEEVYVNQEQEDKESLYIIRNGAPVPISALLGLKDENSFLFQHIKGYSLHFKKENSNVVLKENEAGKITADRERKVNLTERANREVKQPKGEERLVLEDYSAKSVVIKNTTRESGKLLKAYLAEQGIKGAWNPRLTDQDGKRFAGWIFSKKHEETLKDFIYSFHEEVSKRQEEIPEEPIENIEKEVVQEKSEDDTDPIAALPDNGFTEKIDALEDWAKKHQEEEQELWDFQDKADKYISPLFKKEFGVDFNRDNYSMYSQERKDYADVLEGEFLKENLEVSMRLVRNFNLTVNPLEFDLPKEISSSLQELQLKGENIELQIKYDKLPWASAEDVRHLTLEGLLASETGYKSHYHMMHIDDVHAYNLNDFLKDLLVAHLTGEGKVIEKVLEKIEKAEKANLEESQLNLFADPVKPEPVAKTERKGVSLPQEEKETEGVSLSWEEFLDKNMSEVGDLSFVVNPLDFELPENVKEQLEILKERGHNTDLTFEFKNREKELFSTQHVVFKGFVASKTGYDSSFFKFGPEELAAYTGRSYLQEMLQHHFSGDRYNLVIDQLDYPFPSVSQGKKKKSGSQSTRRKVTQGRAKTSKLSNSELNTLEIMRNLPSDGRTFFADTDIYAFKVVSFDENTNRITIAPDHQEDSRILSVKEFEQLLQEARAQNEELKGFSEKAFESLNNRYTQVLEKGNDNSITNEDRVELQDQYWSTIAETGYLHEGRNKELLLKEDSELPRSFLLLGLENWNNRRRLFEGTALIMQEREKEDVSLDRSLSEIDALGYSLNTQNSINPELIEELTGMEWNEVERVLMEEEKLIFKTPEGEWQERAMFLSGNIAKKLKANEDLKGTKYYDFNKEELEAVKIEISAEELDLQLGERWIPLDVYEKFAESIGFYGATIRYEEKEDKFKVQSYSTAALEDQYGGIGRNNARSVLENAFHHNLPSVFFTHSDGTKSLDSESTQKLHERINGIRNKFNEFWKMDEEVRERLLTHYNENNVTIPTTFDGSHLTFDIQGVTPYKHQKDASWMLIQRDGGVVDHLVGAGKTITMLSSAVKMKELGVAKKPMIIVLKSTLQQMEEEFRKIYPTKSLLVPGPSDLSKEGRKEFFSKMLNNDFDCVIMTHEQFGKIPQDHTMQQQVIQTEIEELEDAIWRSSGDDGLNRREMKSLERRKIKLEDKLTALQKLMEKDKDLPTFREIGIDHIFVDESQYFKNLNYTTSHSRVAGLGDQNGSLKANNLLIAIRDIQDRKGGDKGATFLSGTTISNSLVEMYLLLKYLRPNKLKEMKLETFDAWAATYAEKTSDFEFSVTNEMKRKERFRSFIKVPELAALYSEIADIRNDNNLELDKPKGVVTMKTIPASEQQLAFTEELINYVNTSDEPEKMLVATNQSRKMSIDMRLIDPEAKDEPDSKLSIISNNVADIYHRTTEHKATQFIFSDIGTPNPNKPFNVYRELKNKLIERGVKEEEIAFIHDYNSDKQKQKLFSRMNNGEVRIMLGSTSKMGTGVNAQQRCAALHHVDIPWRPSDMEQRNGRGVRQKNFFAKEHQDNKADIFLYATERTLDAYQYELLDRKQRFIDQIKDGSVGRRIDEGAGDDESGMDFAEYVAILSGNDDLRKKVKLEKEIEQLGSKRKLFYDEVKRHDYNIEKLENQLTAFKNTLANDRKEIEFLHANNKAVDKDGKECKVELSNFQGMELKGEKIEKFVDAGRALIELSKENKKRMDIGLGGSTSENIGKYLGYDIVMNVENTKHSGNMTAIHLKSPHTGLNYKYDRGIIDPFISSHAAAAFVKEPLNKMEERAMRLENKSIPDTIKNLERLRNETVETVWPDEDKLEELKGELRSLIKSFDEGQKKEEDDGLTQKSAGVTV